MGNDVTMIQGAGQGLGLALAAHILAHQDNSIVVATCREPDKSSGLGKLQQKYTSRLVTQKLDVSNEKSIVSASKKISSQIEHISLLINSSGILHDDSIYPEKRLADISAFSLERSYAINAIGPILVLKHFRSLIQRGKKSVIVNMSARVASIEDNSIGGWYSYRSSKASLNQITKTIAIEFARQLPKSICIAFHPGSVNTRLSKPFQKAIPKEKLFEPDYAAAKMVAVINNLTTSDNGSFLAWDGSKIPW
jgi:NAD(P)-dependent dehydrogenase (short-subunit alcohol dehydrogenase family)